MAMNPSSSGKRPSFFWQGLMILLPVLVLAVVGLVSLRQDEQTAAQTARKRAAENAASLAGVLRAAVAEEFQQFDSLQKVWSGYELSALFAASPFPDEKLQSLGARWEQNHYPALSFADLATPTGEITTGGLLRFPPDFPQFPVPPKWYSDLSSAQKKLWQNLRQAASDGNKAEIQAADGDFRESNPPNEAHQAANCLSLPPEKIVGGYAQAAESGVSFQDLACYRLLDTNAPLSRGVWNLVWRHVSQHPSFVTPALLDLAQARAVRADHSIQEEVRCARRLWNSQCLARQWIDSVRAFPEFRRWSNPPQYWSRWTGAASGESLACFEPCTYPQLGGPSDDVPGSGRGWQIHFIPRQVVEAVLARALAMNQTLVPDYAVAGLTLNGERLPMAGRSSWPDESSLLAGRAGAIDSERTAYSGSSEVPFNLNVTFYLVSREKMLADERRRSRLFGALIGAAVLAALAGLITARRAFFQQRRLGEMKTNFVSSVSHELRAPIASMRLLAEALERGKITGPAKQHEYHRFLVQESRRLTSLIENVLDFSRIEQGRKEYRFEPVDLDFLAAQTVKLMRPGAAERGVELALLPGSAPAPQLSCDGLALQQALINLIDNAVKHSPAGSQITVGLESDDRAVRLWVEDHGSGIPPEDHVKIFERFYRRGSELRRETQGIGIGLAIVKHIVEARGGRVLVRSAAGQGSRFTIELPLKEG